MGFFDELKRNVTDAGQKTVQKTKDLAEVSRINSQISQNDNKISNLYYEIGKLFVSMYGTNCDGNFKGMVEAIQAAENENAELRARALDLKGVMRCENCGAEVPRGNAFCSACGAAMPRIEVQSNPNDFVRCPGCGNMVARGMRFCTICGNQMTAQVNTAPAAPVAPAAPTAPAEVPAAPAEAPAAPAEEAEARVCPKCGAPVNGNVRFCMKCGEPLA